MIPPEQNRTIRKSNRYLVVAHQTGSSLAFHCGTCSHITPPTRGPGWLCRERRRYRKHDKRWHSGDSTGCRRLPPISVLCISADAVNSHNMKSIMYLPASSIPTPVLMWADRAFLIIATKGRQLPSTTAILAHIKNAGLISMSPGRKQLVIQGKVISD